MWRQGQTQHPYTLSFLGTWGHGEYSLGYIDVETGTDTPPLNTLSFLGMWGHGEYSLLGYIHVETGTHTTPIYTLISGDVGTRGVSSSMVFPRLSTIGVLGTLTFEF